MQPRVDDFAETLTAHFLSNGERLVGTYDHMPVMKYILDQKFRGTYEQARALNELLKAGVMWKDALEMLDIDKTLKQNENANNGEGAGQGIARQTQANGGEGEEREE